MKFVSLLIYSLFGILNFTYAVDQNRISHQSIPVYNLKNEGTTVILPTDFAEPFILDEKNLKILKATEIYQIDLVYTRYCQSENFDQHQLNTERINQLKKLLPTVELNQPNWKFIEQTKATDRSTAQSFFHGFVIYYRPKSVDHVELQERFKKYQSQTQQYLINANTDTSLSYPSGTVIHFPANAVSFPDGTAVEGDFELTYTEFRNPAEIALSGIPMTYNENGEALNFSSIGMYEITGRKNGQELQLNQPIIIDFNATKVVDDADFYQLNDETQAWEKIEPVVFENNDSTNNATSDNSSNASIRNVDLIPSNGDESFENPERGTKVQLKTDRDGKSIAKLNRKAWKVYESLKDDPRITNLVISEFPGRRKIELIEETSKDFGTSIIMERYQKSLANLYRELMARKANGEDVSKNLEFAQMTAGQTIPTVVEGLRTTRFGVYNCDQVYRMGRRITITPIYLDAATSEPIDSAHVTCVMDLRKNGSFSFNPNYVTLNPNGKNALLLFTMDDRIFYYDPVSMSQADLSNGEPTLYMKDVTDQIKSSKDLEKLLDL